MKCNDCHREARAFVNPEGEKNYVSSYTNCGTCKKVICNECVIRRPGTMGICRNCYHKPRRKVNKWDLLFQQAFSIDNSCCARQVLVAKIVLSANLKNEKLTQNDYVGDILGAWRKLHTNQLNYKLSLPDRFMEEVPKSLRQVDLIRTHGPYILPSSIVKYMYSHGYLLIEYYIDTHMLLTYEYNIELIRNECLTINNISSVNRPKEYNCRSSHRLKSILAKFKNCYCMINTYEGKHFVGATKSCLYETGHHEPSSISSRDKFNQLLQAQSGIILVFTNAPHVIGNRSGGSYGGGGGSSGPSSGGDLGGGGRK